MGDRRTMIPTALRRLAPLAGLVLWALSVAAITLVPGASQVADPGPEVGDDFGQLCILCGSRGTADALLNIVLFAPMGLLLSAAGLAAKAIVVLAAATSTTIELVQLTQPGRYPTLGDVVWNTAGGAVGVWSWRLLQDRFRPGSPTRLGSRASRHGPFMVATFLFSTWIVFGSLLLRPAATGHTYYILVRPQLALMPVYQGDVRQTKIDGTAVPRGGPLPESSPRMPDLHGDWSLSSHVLLGPEPEAISPVVGVYDGAQSEIALLGIHGTTFVLRIRRLADALRFDRPDYRWEGALDSTRTGDEIRLGARSRTGDICLTVDNSERCGLAPTPGRTWGFLLYLEGPSEAKRRVADLAWIAAISFPIGLLATSLGTATTGAGVVLAVLLGVPAFSGLHAVPPAELFVALLALTFGFTFARWVDSYRGHSSNVYE